jgi:hypothetical protein
MKFIGSVLGGLLVFGFYGHVFSQLYREHERIKAQERRLPEHFYAMESEHETKGARPQSVPVQKVLGDTRKDALIHAGVAVGGLLGLFSQIAFLNWLVSGFR